MKFSLFLHMERYDDNKTHQESLAELTELVQIAEKGGFEMAWVGEHHSMEFTIAPNPINYITYLANKTSSIRLGAGTFIAPFWHPVKLAGEAALADIMCDGRLEFGIARGAYQAEFDRLMNGMPSADGGKYLREMVPVLQKLWAATMLTMANYSSSRQPPAFLSHCNTLIHQCGLLLAILIHTTLQLATVVMSW